MGAKIEKECLSGQETITVVQEGDDAVGLDLGASGKEVKQIDWDDVQEQNGHILPGYLDVARQNSEELLLMLFKQLA